MSHPNFLPSDFRKALVSGIVSSGGTASTGLAVKHFEARSTSLSLVLEKIFLGAVLVVFLAIAAFGYPLADGMYRFIKVGPLLAEAKTDFEQGNFSGLYKKAEQINYHLGQLSQDTAFIKKLHFVPWLGEVTENTHSAVLGSQKIVSVFLPTLEILSSANGQVHDIAPEQKRAIIEHISTKSSELALAASLLKSTQLPFVSQTLAQSSQGLQKLAYIAPELPDILGVNKEARYLLIFANNLEIRPGGGFIGTYGILTIKNGEIASLDIRDVYNLPGPKDGRFGPPAPPIVQSSLGVVGFPFRDANWWPDYPTTARVLKNTYTLEGGEYAGEIKGVITVTTEMLKKIVEFTGPVRVGDIVFTKDNAVSELQKQVEITFWEQGIPETRRKDIVGDLAIVLHNKIMTFNFAQNVSLLESLADLAQRNHLVFYFENTKLQNLVMEQNWDGSLQNYDSDTLMIVDANLIGYKTESLMTKNYTYNVRQENGKLVSDLTLHYKHRAQFISPLVHNYRTYVRVYVPDGAKLLASSGADSDVDIGREGNRSVFGAFLVVPVGQEHTVKFSYELPQNVRVSDYTLFVQKQIGAYPFVLHVNIDFDNVNKSINDIVDTNKIYYLDGRTITN